MKKFSFFITFFAAILTGIAIVSACSDDDESGIVGTWMYTDYDDSAYKDEYYYYMFCSDGTAYEFEECSEHGCHAQKSKYTYDERTGKLTMTWDYGSGDTYTGTYDVEISGNKLIIEEEDLILKRVSSPFSKSELERYSRDYHGSR